MVADRQAASRARPHYDGDAMNTIAILGIVAILVIGALLFLAYREPPPPPRGKGIMGVLPLLFAL